MYQSEKFSKLISNRLHKFENKFDFQNLLLNFITIKQNILEIRRRFFASVRSAQKDSYK